MNIGLLIFLVAISLMAGAAMLTPKQKRQLRCWFIPSPTKKPYIRSDRDKDTGRYL